MSGAVVLVPLLTAVPWSAVGAAVIGAAASLGYSVAKAGPGGIRGMLSGMFAPAVKEAPKGERAEVVVENTDLAAQDLAGVKEFVLERGGITIHLRRKTDGTCVVCADGAGHSKAELEASAKEVAQRLVQQMIYNKVVTELTGHDFEIVDQEIDDSRRIRIRVSRWVE